MSDAADESSSEPPICTPLHEGTPAAAPQWWEPLRKELGLERSLRLNDPTRPVPLLGRFEGLHYQGRGGFGVVFAARDPQLDRKVALKFCRVPTATNRATLMREAQLMAKLAHPNVIRVYEAGWHGEHPFFVMEHAPRKNGDHFMFRWPSPSWQEIVTMYARAGAGLAAIHERGMVHGDFKPSNILLGEHDWPLITDFGLAHREASEGGCAGGTLKFSAPEVQMGQRPDAASDLWSFCVSLGQTLARGEPLFEGKTHEQMLSSIFAGPPEAPEGVPEWLWAIVMRGLAIEPTDRYASMRALLDDLEHGGDGHEFAERERVELAAQSSSALELGRTPAVQTPPTRGYRQFATHMLNTSLTALIMAFLFMPGREATAVHAAAEVVAEQAPEVQQPAVNPRAEQAHAASDSPGCVTGKTPISTIPDTLIETCTKVRQGEFNLAIAEWKKYRELKYRDARQYEQAPDEYNSLILQLAAETKIVADPLESHASGLVGVGLQELANSRAQGVKTWYLWDYQNLKPSQP